MPKKYLLFIAAILVCAYYPLLIPERIFSLDQAFPYYYDWPKFGANNFWIHVVWNIFQALHIPLIILEKLVYVGMLGSIVFFWYRIFSRFENHLATTFWIVFLLGNPFFYARFVEGQVNVYVSYAIFVIFFYYFLEYFFSQKFHYWKQLTGLVALLGLTSLHNVFLVALPLCIWYIFLFIQTHDKKYILKKLWFLSLVLVIVNSLWILPTMMRGSLTSQIESFWESHRSAFESPSWSYENVYINLAALKGYWWEGENRFAPAELRVPGNWVFLLTILWLIWVWVFANMMKSCDKKRVFALISIALISYILALWSSQGNIFSGVNNFLFQYIPYYTGFREPHKWILLLTLVYGYFAAAWISHIQQYIRSKNIHGLWVKILLSYLLLLPILYTPAVLIGYWGQLKTSQYPQDWKELRQNIQQDAPQECEAKKNLESTKCYSTLVFPWHGYINIAWTQKPIVLWSIMKFFGRGTLYWDTLEIRNIYTQSNRPESKIIEQYTPRLWITSQEFEQETGEQFITDLRSLGIRNILLLKESDFETYDVITQGLVKNNLLTKIYENNLWSVYSLE